MRTSREQLFALAASACISNNVDKSRAGVKKGTWRGLAVPENQKVKALILSISSPPSLHPLAPFPFSLFSFSSPRFVSTVERPSSISKVIWHELHGIYGHFGTASSEPDDANSSVKPYALLAHRTSEGVSEHHQWSKGQLLHRTLTSTDLMVPASSLPLLFFLPPSQLTHCFPVNVWPMWQFCGRIDSSLNGAR